MEVDVKNCLDVFEKKIQKNFSKKSRRVGNFCIVNLSIKNNASSIR